MLLSSVRHVGYLGCFTMTVMAVLLARSAGASTERQDFSTWTMSDSSVSVVSGQLFIGSTGCVGPTSLSCYNDGAKKAFFIDLTDGKTVILEQRLKLESGGLNYRLPYQVITFEDASILDVTYLAPPPSSYGWLWGDYAGITDPEVPGDGWWTSATADYWTVTKIMITSTGGVLYMRPDDAARGWFSDEFSFVTSSNWSHSRITEIQFSQPWDSVNRVDYMDITIHPAIDIRPWSDVNPINPFAQGVIPVAILGAEMFDVADVDVTTLAFGPDGAAPAHEQGGHFQDVNDDGFTDLLSHYRTQQTGIAVGDAEACLTGETLDGTPFEGCDIINTQPPCGNGYAAALVVPPVVWIGGRMRRRRP